MKKLTKAQTIICSNLYNSNHFVDEYTLSKFIDASLKLAESFPDVFKITSSSLVHVTIVCLDLEKCLSLLKYNEHLITVKVG